MPASKPIASQKVQPFDVQRQLVACVTSSSWETVPHVAYLYEPDVTGFYAAFKTLAAERKEKASTPYKITFNSIMLKAITEGMLAAPELNALLEYDPKTSHGHLQLCADVNISLPWLLPDGRMISIVIPQTNKKSLDAISAVIAAIREKIEHTKIDELLSKVVSAATAKKSRQSSFDTLQPKVCKHPKNTPSSKGKQKRTLGRVESICLTMEDIVNGTVTVSNIGSLYREQQGFFGLLEVVPPQVMAIGMSAVQEKPGIFMDKQQRKQIGIRKFLPLCLCFDHRALDFNALVPFLKRMDKIFACPEEVFNW